MGAILASACPAERVPRKDSVEAGRKIDNNSNMTHPAIEIYTRSWCGYCFQAKALLDRKGLPYTEYDVEAQPERLAEMLDRADGRRTVPQVFIDGAGIGGYTELATLEQSGKLLGETGQTG